MDRKQRLKQFKHAARELGEKFQHLGRSEEQLMEDLEQTRRKLFDARHRMTNNQGALSNKTQETAQFAKMTEELRKRFSDMGEDEITRLVDEAVAEVRSEHKRRKRAR